MTLLSLSSPGACSWAIAPSGSVRACCGTASRRPRSALCVAAARTTRGASLPAAASDTFDFDGKSIAFEARSFHKRSFEDNTFGMAFYGEGGTLLILDGGYRILDMNNKEVAKVPGSSNQAPYFQGFQDAMKSGKRPSADAEDGYKSTMRCHLGNIAYRTHST